MISHSDHSNCQASLFFNYRKHYLHQNKGSSTVIFILVFALITITSAELCRHTWHQLRSTRSHSKHHQRRKEQQQTLLYATIKNNNPNLSLESPNPESPNPESPSPPLVTRLFSADRQILKLTSASSPINTAPSIWLRQSDSAIPLPPWNFLLGEANERFLCQLTNQPELMISRFTCQVKASSLSTTQAFLGNLRANTLLINGPAQIISTGSIVIDTITLSRKASAVFIAGGQIKISQIVYSEDKDILILIANGGTINIGSITCLECPPPDITNKTSLTPPEEWHMWSKHGLCLGQGECRKTSEEKQEFPLPWPRSVIIGDG